MSTQTGGANSSAGVRPAGGALALNDPLGVVVELLVALEPGLDRLLLTGIVEAVAPGRLRRRRLAQALSEQPAVLRQGRAPAPRVVADLLIALNRAGAVNISAPRCSGCQKELGSIHHRGQDWYCGACGPRREPCAGCQNTLLVSCRDRDGQAHCVNCPPVEQDPLDIITAVVHVVAPAIPTEEVADAVRVVAPRAGARRRHFIRWAATQKLTALSLPAIAWNGPGPIDAQARWDQARQLLHDDTLKPQDRVAGLLILLYAQEPATIARLTLQDIDTSNGQTRLRLGPEPVLLPEPLDALVLALIATRHPHGRAVTGDRGTSTWLFPGGRPGQPISPQQLRARLTRLGIRPAQARTATLFHLATELPAALLARMLGIHITVAVRWQQVSAGDWTTYAADLAQRSTP